MKLLKGADVAQKINERVSAEALELAGPLRLAIVRVGERPDDLSYERGVLKRFAALSLRTIVYALPADISQADFAAAFLRVNADPDIHGILLFRPLPAQLDEEWAMRAIDPDKDVDGISPVNLAKVFAGDPTGFAPCTAAAVMEMLAWAEVGLKGREAVVVGRSLVIGKPVSMLLLGEHATVTVCHSRTQNLPAVCRRADVLVACVGKAGLIGADHIRPDAVVIDVGINVDTGGRLTGDVNRHAAENAASLYSPVPGGVGAVTTAVMARHLLRAARRQIKS
ncbi:MAG: bifunctional 5,10-methylenetetrahydrofolate dehydrogenase/5,10-methenyltetrahydrofolate cyclohydrolase [Gracilibacteraceae bacterium]|jgi:methylenetetrahydrofolate dehydrogenase (NADP+)/methenyltetrahydrofolate cyclohydrolase|nr:bifunctional 5,10-methylenetetrahydrofolate dehydrogenase/5,10-methenyltetrahydrofolate cyclohydrolase [Gracilibacteraceae bacterium]